MTDDNRALKVFLCHAHADRSVVRELYQRLKGEGWIEPWLDVAKILPGQHWTTVIRQSLAEADSVIILISNNSIDREGFVQREMNLAWDLSLEKPRSVIYLIPLRIEDCEVPFDLRERQWADYFGEGKDETYNALLQSLKLRHEQKLRVEAEERARQEKQRQKRELDEKAYLDAREAEKEANEKARLETEEAEKRRLAKEQADREAADKIAREKARLEAEEAERRRLAKEQAERKAADAARAAREKAERDAAEKAAREKEERNKKKGKQNALIIVALIVLAGTIVALVSSPFLRGLFLPMPESTIEPTQMQVPATPTVFNPHTDASDFFDSHGVPMRLVPAGEFEMGSANNASNEAPIHTVYLESYYMDKYEVTNVLYKACVDASRCKPPKQTNTYTRVSYYGSSEFDNYPVIYVDWVMAKTYCEWRGASLPTEAQWEKAARGTDGRTYPWGEGIDCGKANYWRKDGGCVDDTTPVGSYESGQSPYGIYDLAGNVWEWTADWYTATYYQNSPVENPLGPDSGQERVLRSGAWNSNSVNVRSALRDYHTPDHIAANDLIYFNTGFRCASSP